MQRNKKLLVAVCGMISMFSQAQEADAQAGSTTVDKATTGDSRAVKSGATQKSGFTTNSNAKSGSSQAKTGIQCEWTNSPKVVEQNCNDKNTKTCLGIAVCTEDGSAPFRADVSCEWGVKQGGVKDCSDASECANSDSGVGTETCSIHYYDSQKSGAASSKSGAASSKSGGSSSKSGGSSSKSGGVR